MARYEQVVFLDSDDDYDEFEEILIDEGEVAALEHLKQWHYPGEHDTRDEPGYGSSDQVYDTDDGYIMSWNTGLSYASLEYDTEADDEGGS